MVFALNGIAVHIKYSFNERKIVFNYDILINVYSTKGQLKTTISESAETVICNGALFCQNFSLFSFG